MEQLFKDLREGIKKLQQPEDPTNQLTMMALSVLEHFLHDHKRIADALEAIAINIEESHPDMPDIGPSE